MGVSSRRLTCVWPSAAAAARPDRRQPSTTIRAEVLFADEAGPPTSIDDHRRLACGFYWTEGVRGLGWAVDAIPTLKGGSTVGVPSPPAIWLPDGRVRHAGHS